MKDTIQISITINNEQLREQLIAQLSATDYYAFEEKDYELIAFIDAKDFEPSLLEGILSPHNVAYTKTIIEDQNWNALWESNFEAVVVDDFCAIRADFHQPFTSKQHEIIITPKMSFGTGHHATTFMMIMEMSKLNFRNKRVADFGTGTGVLAILAEKLESNYVWAVDIDDWSIENATENIEKNHCKKIEIEKTDGFHTHQKFDIILANINKNVILANIDNLLFAINPTGQILISGLLAEDESDVVAAFRERGFIQQSVIQKNKWVCLLLQYGIKSQ